MRKADEGQNIDFVITWVDGNDPEWQREKRQDLDIWGYLQV